jgi:hypothetical protein
MEPTAAQPIAEQPAIAVTPGEGTFDITPMWERFEKHQAAETAKAAEAPVEQKTEEKPAEEAAKPEVKAEEKPAETTEKLPKMTENAGKAFAALKAEIKELREQKLPATEKLANEREIALQEAQKRLAEFEGKDISQYEKKISDLEAKYSEAEKFRAIHDVQNSEAYRSEILQPAAEIGDQMDILAKMYDMDANDLKNALQIEDQAEQRRKINELTDGWNQLDAVDLLAAARQTRQLLSKSQHLLDSAEKTKGELKFIEEQEGKKKAELEEQTHKVSKESVTKMYLEKIPFLKDKPELTEALKSVAPSKDIARQYSAAYAETLLPHTLDANDKLTARVAELESLLAKKASAKPNPSSANSQQMKADESLPGGYGSDDVHARWMAFQAKG